MMFGNHGRYSRTHEFVCTLLPTVQRTHNVYPITTMPMYRVWESSPTFLCDHHHII